MTKTNMFSLASQIIGAIFGLAGAIMMYVDMSVLAPWVFLAFFISTLGLVVFTLIHSYLWLLLLQGSFLFINTAGVLKYWFNIVI